MTEFGAYVRVGMGITVAAAFRAKKYYKINPKG